jgi:NAD(P)-dependent dehydrogenase (short-subunit alcohol dehydrogenase family)
MYITSILVPFFSLIITMTEFIPNEAKFADLKGKVVVITGGASGIGAATVTRLHGVGALVVFGDIAAQPADSLVSSLNASSGTGEVSFVHCDVTNYDDIYNLVKAAYDKYGRIDHVLACAGIFEKGQWFDPELTIESVKNEKGPQLTLDINVLGLANFARVAVVFMREGMKKGDNKSITFMSSVIPGVSRLEHVSDLKTCGSRSNAINAQAYIRKRRHQSQYRQSWCDGNSNDSTPCSCVQAARLLLPTP